MLRPAGLCLALLLGTVAGLSGCGGPKAKTAPLGKGGLPTNNIEGMASAGQEGTVLAVPAEMLYPGATEIEGRPYYYRTDATVAEARAWVEANIPGAVGVDEDNEAYHTYKGKEWTVEVWDDDGKAVLRYAATRFRYPDSK